MGLVCLGLRGRGALAPDCHSWACLSNPLVTTHKDSSLVPWRENRAESEWVARLNARKGLGRHWDFEMKNQVVFDEKFHFLSFSFLPVFVFFPTVGTQNSCARLTRPEMTNTCVSSRLKVQPLLPHPGPTLHYAASLTIGFNTRSSSGIDNGPTSLQWEQSRQLSHKELSHTEGILA